MDRHQRSPRRHMRRKLRVESTYDFEGGRRLGKTGGRGCRGGLPSRAFGPLPTFTSVTKNGGFLEPFDNSMLARCLLSARKHP